MPIFSSSASGDAARKTARWMARGPFPAPPPTSPASIVPARIDHLKRQQGINARPRQQRMTPDQGAGGRHRCQYGIALFGAMLMFGANRKGVCDGSP